MKHQEHQDTKEAPRKALDAFVKPVAATRALSVPFALYLTHDRSNPEEEDRLLDLERPRCPGPMGLSAARDLSWCPLVLPLVNLVVKNAQTI